MRVRGWNSESGHTLLHRHGHDGAQDPEIRLHLYRRLLPGQYWLTTKGSLEGKVWVDASLMLQGRFLQLGRQKRK